MGSKTIPTTDKVNGYLGLYREIFVGLFDKPLVLLELGVAEGGSLSIWKDWFPLARIIGIDKDLSKVALTNLQRITLYEGDQQDEQFLHGVGDAKGPFDIIIDDCSHLAGPTQLSFRLLFDCLRPGGLYCIEDWGTGYWDPISGFDGQRYICTSPGHHEAGMVGFVKDLIDELGMPSITDERFGNPPRRPSRFYKMEIYPGIVVVRKEKYGWGPTKSE